MNKLTKIALGLCVAKVGIETTKYISGKWGNGKMKKNIENAQIAIANAIEEDNQITNINALFEGQDISINLENYTNYLSNREDNYS